MTEALSGWNLQNTVSVRSHLTNFFQNQLEPNTQLHGMQPLNSQGPQPCLDPNAINHRGASPLRALQASSFSASAISNQVPTTLSWTGFGHRSLGQGLVTTQQHEPPWSAIDRSCPTLLRSGQRRESEYASCHHNVVDIERIGKGLDVRTTVSVWVSQL